MNPRASEAFLEQERVLLGADFAREYEAQFVSGAHSFLDADELRDVVGRYTELGPGEVSGAVVGFDPLIIFGIGASACSTIGASPGPRSARRSGSVI